jgi:DNA repair protein RadC
MNSIDRKISIKDLSEEDRPREKLLNKGRRSLTDAELLAILIGSGNRSETAVQLCQRILSDLKNDLNKLGKLEVSELMKYKGIGEAKAISIIAALEIGRRRKSENQEESQSISSSKAAYEYFISNMADLAHEEFWVLLLNRANKPIDIKMVGSGGVSATIVDVKIILKLAIEKLASSIIIAHNHPSGSLFPSDADKEITNKIKNACKLIDIPLLDHLIVTDRSFYSFNDEGNL